MARASWRDDLDVLDRIERELTVEQLVGLRQLTDARGIERDAWLAIPSLAQVFTVAAWTNLARRLEGSGMGAGHAQDLAAFRLGVPLESLRSMTRRWTQAAA